MDLPIEINKTHYGCFEEQTKQEAKECTIELPTHSKILLKNLDEGPNFSSAKTGLIYNPSSKRYRELIHSIAKQSREETSMTLERKRKNNE